ncbi:transglycosylase SLT domain-containing protein [Roseateles chitinivorans]|uniref:transglycosylase SLT domain-containing protein n=1 Tax=Roseateles chitinivorans TaxID=2917965 RepID=UPI003D671179
MYASSAARRARPTPSQTERTSGGDATNASPLHSAACSQADAKETPQHGPARSSGTRASPRVSNLTAHALTTASALLFMLSPAMGAACWRDAAQRHGVPVALLHAVARVESNLDAQAINRSHFVRTGTYDIGLMQINSSHLKTLRRYGVDEAALLNPCINLHIGAWLLADAISRHGMSWNAVGAYNAACTRLHPDACSRARARYAWKVYRHLREKPMSAQASTGQPSAGDGCPRPCRVGASAIRPASPRSAGS